MPKENATFLSFNSSLYLVVIDLVIDSTTQSYVNITGKIIIVPISAQKAKIISQSFFYEIYIILTPISTIQRILFVLH